MKNYAERLIFDKLTAFLSSLIFHHQSHQISINSYVKSTPRLHGLQCILCEINSSFGSQCFLLIPVLCGNEPDTLQMCMKNYNTKSSF